MPMLTTCRVCKATCVLTGLIFVCAGCGNATYQASPTMLPPFDPSQEYGYEYHYEGKYTALSAADISWLKGEAERVINHGYYYELRGLIPAHYGRDKKIAWYYNPNLPHLQYRGLLKVPVVNGSYVALGGFISGGSTILFANGSKIATAMDKILAVEEEEADCRCGHSWYDHIGWRVGTKHEGRKDCRIVGCSCGESCGGYRP